MKIVHRIRWGTGASHWRRTLGSLTAVAVAAATLVVGGSDVRASAAGDTASIEQVADKSDRARILDRSERTSNGESVIALPCGRSSQSDGSGGWFLYWNNCWGVTGKGLAPVWHNGQGNSYTNVRDSDGFDMCLYIPSGQTGVWWIRSWELPPEPTNYTGVIFCLP